MGRGPRPSSAQTGGAEDIAASLDRLIEREIHRAIAEGPLDDPKGEPPPDRPEDAHSDRAMQVGLRTLVAAGVLPEVLQLKSLVEAA